MRDLRFAFRQLVKTPGFTAVVVLSLALGIGANATVLCWLRALVLHPLPGVAHEEQIVVVVSPQGGGNASLPDLRDIGNTREVFAGTLAHMPTPVCLTLDEETEWTQAQIVTANFFDLLGVKPILGRTFFPEEDQKPGGNPVAVISERLWRRRFGASPAVLGRTLELNRHAFTIIGVAPASFTGTLAPTPFDVWAPASMIWEVRNQDQSFLSARGARGWLNLARLQPGVTLAQARAAMAALDAQLAKAYPRTNTDIRHRILPLSECPWGAPTVMGPPLRLLLAVSLGVLLIVGANVANLLLARGAGRQKEIAIRLAAGASRGRLVRQLLTESLLLAALGGGLGVLFATWAADVVPLFLPADLTRDVPLSFQLDAGTLVLTLLLTVAAAVAFGLFPAWQATRPDLYAALKDGGRASSSGPAQHRMRGLLVIAEIAVALVLLIGSALCLQGLRQARRIDCGFQPDHVLLGHLQIGMNGYNRQTGPAFYRAAQERLAALPGVEEVALASWFPLGLSGCKGAGVSVDGYQRPPGEDTTYEYAVVSPRYFATMRTPLVAGREFTLQDDADAPKVVVVNEAFAQRFWPGQEAVGRRFSIGGLPRTVIAVAKTGKYNRLNEAPRPFFFVCYLQGVPDLDLSLCIRTGGDPASFAGTLRQTIQAIDPRVELLRTLPLSAHAGLVLFPHRMASALLLLLGSVALLLAAMGVYAVIAYGVTQRIREYGVRMALGARPVDVLWQVLRRGLTLALLGSLAGVALAAAVTRLLGSFLYGVSPFDLATFLAAPVVLLLVALLACYLPARRATRINPIEALRAE